MVGSYILRDISLLWCAVPAFTLPLKASQCGATGDWRSSAPEPIDLCVFDLIVVEFSIRHGHGTWHRRFGLTVEVNGPDILPCGYHSELSRNLITRDLSLLNSQQLQAAERFGKVTKFREASSDGTERRRQPQDGKYKIIIVDWSN